MKKIEHIESVEYLRFIMSVFVVIWHMKGAGTSLIFSKEQYLKNVFTLSDFFNFHVLLLAVPAFICLSNFLFATREPNLSYLKKRAKRLLLLLSFWTPCLLLYKYGAYGLYQIMPSSFPSLVIFVLNTGHTPFYFFICLLFTTCITYASLKLRTSVVFLALLISILLLLVAPLLTKKMDLYPLSAYWNPLNFLPYSFIAVFLSRFSNFIANRKSGIILFLLGATTVFSIIEWKFYTGSIFFPGQGYAIPAYTRNSLVFSTTALLIIAFTSKIKSNTVVRFFSTNALALYCLHPFFKEPAIKLVSFVIKQSMLSLWISIVLVLLLSYTLPSALKFYLNENIIR